MSTTTAPSNGWHWREWAAEFAGTGLLLFAVVTAKDWIVRAGPPISEIWIRVALVGTVAGLMVIAIAYSPLGRRSGAHLNPVVTLGLALRGTVAAADLAGYPVAQAAGGIAGVAVARIWGPTVSAAAMRWAVIAPAGWIGQPTAAVIEAAATAVMLAVVFGCLASADRARLAAPAADSRTLSGTSPVAWPDDTQGCTPDSDAHVKPEPPRQYGPSVAVRGNADGAHRPSELCTPTALTARTAVRYTSVDSAT